MLGLGFRMGGVASLLAAVPSIPGITPGVRLTWSQPLARGTPVPAGTTLVGRKAGSTFAAADPGLVIDNATGAVSGTPTRNSALVVELLGGVSHNSLTFTPARDARIMRLGMNMGAFAYYTSSYLFLNYLRQASAQSDAGTGSYDANGMPTAVGTYNAGTPGTQYLFPMDDGSVTPFPIRIITDGDLDLGLRGSAGGIALTKTSDGWTGMWTGGVIADTRFANQLVISAIRQAPTFLALVRESDVAAWRAWKAGTRSHEFQDWFVAEVARFSRIRCMDWTSTNEEDYFPQTAGALCFTNPNSHRQQCAVPLSTMVDLANAARAINPASGDLWFNLHCKMTDAQFQATWPQLDRLLAAGGNAILEWSNEVWNFAFPQSYYATDQCNAIPNKNSFTPGYERTWYVGYRSAQLAKLARGRGYQFVAGVQGVFQAQQDVLEAGLQFAGGTWSDFYGWTTVGYIYGSWAQHRADIGEAQYQRQKAMVAAQDFDSALDDVINYSGSYGISTASSVAGYWKDSKAQADARGLKLVVYEGNALSFIGAGTYTGNGGADAGDYAGFDQFCVGMCYHPLSPQVALDMLLAAQGAGITEFMEYCFDAAKATSTGNGIWGLYGQPAYQGLLAFLAIPYTAPGPITVDPAVTRTGSDYRFTARRTTNIANVETRQASVGSSTAFAPGATPSDLGGAFPTATVTFAAGAATTTFVVTSPTAIPE